MTPTTLDLKYDLAVEAALDYLAREFSSNEPARQPESQKINAAILFVNKWREGGNDEIEVTV